MVALARFHIAMIVWVFRVYVHLVLRNLYVKLKYQMPVIHRPAIMVAPVILNLWTNTLVHVLTVIQVIKQFFKLFA